MQRAHRCDECGAEFASRNKLFKHVRNADHYSAGPRQKPDTVVHAVYELTAHTLPLIKGAAPTRHIEKIDLFEDGRAFVLRNVLSELECDGYMAAAEKLGMSSVQSAGYERRVRVCHRVTASSDELASQLFGRIAPFLHPIDLSSTDVGTRPPGVPKHRARTVWRPHGLNELFRICKYETGGHFAPHLDGGHTRSGSDSSMQTFMLYLNDGFEGGNTRFFDESQRAYQPHDATKVVATYLPRRGDALVFASELMHDGEALRSGRKWILRSEVMYTWEDDGANALLERLYNGMGGDGCVAGVEETVLAVEQGCAATVLIGANLQAEYGGVALEEWFAHRLQGAKLVVVPASAMLAEQFFKGLEGVGALLRADATAPSGDSEGSGAHRNSKDDEISQDYWLWKKQLFDNLRTSR